MLFGSKKFIRRTALVFALAVFHAPAAMAAQCVQVLFYDAQGNFIPVETPVTGIMLGGRPVVEGRIPANSTMKPGSELKCPQSLLDLVSNLFDESCSTTERREETAKAHGSSIDVVNQGCRDLNTAINAEE